MPEDTGRRAAMTLTTAMEAAAARPLRVCGWLLPGLFATGSDRLATLQRTS